MSDHHLNDPFASPGTGAPQWQGAPVPLPPTTHIPPPPMPQNQAPGMAAYPPQPPTHIPPPPMAQNQAPAMAAYPPPPPAGYMYAPVYNTANTASNWMGITSLILSLATLIFGITFIPGIILGHMGLSAAKRGTANNRGLALAGVIIGWVFLGLGLLFVALVIVAVAVDGSGA